MSVSFQAEPLNNTIIMSVVGVDEVKDVIAKWQHSSLHSSNRLALSDGR